MRLGWGTERHGCSRRMTGNVGRPSCLVCFPASKYSSIFSNEDETGTGKKGGKAITSNNQHCLPAGWVVKWASGVVYIELLETVFILSFLYPRRPTMDGKRVRRVHDIMATSSTCHAPLSPPFPSPLLWVAWIIAMQSDIHNCLRTLFLIDESLKTGQYGVQTKCEQRKMARSTAHSSSCSLARTPHHFHWQHFKASHPSAAYSGPSSSFLSPSLPDLLPALSSPLLRLCIPLFTWGCCGIKAAYRGNCLFTWQCVK